jgi:hypothetical protein
MKWRKAETEYKAKIFAQVSLTPRNYQRSEPLKTDERMKRAIAQAREQYDRGDAVIETDMFSCTRDFLDKTLPEICRNKK